MKRIALLLSILCCGTTFADTINLKYMNEDNTVYESATCTVGDDLIIPTPPIKRGYTFAGWRAGNIQKIEYLESTGLQWIDTGYYPNQDTGIKTKIQTIGGGQDENIYFGINADCKYYGWSWGSSLYFGYRNENITQNTIRLNDIIEYNYNKHIYDYYINDVKQNTVLFNYSNFNCKKSLWIFSLNVTNYTVSSYHTKMKLYYFQIYDNNILVRDFIPVLDGNDTPCLYDKVEGKFYYNQGTSNFIAGPVISE